MTSNESKKKRVHFIRHAESLCNLFRREKQMHLLPLQEKPVVIDPALTLEGVEQTKRLKEYLQTLQLEIAVSSPYTRALQTCLLSFGSNNVIITPLCGEVIELCCDDIGLPASFLKVAFPVLDFSSLNEIWWYVQDGIKHQSDAVNLLTQGKLTAEPEEHLAARINKFYDFLCKMPQQNVVVYAHNDFLVLFLSKYFGFDESHLDNCEVYSVDMSSNVAIAK